MKKFLILLGFLVLVAVPSISKAQTDTSTSTSTKQFALMAVNQVAPAAPVTGSPVLISWLVSKVSSTSTVATSTLNQLTFDVILKKVYDPSFTRVIASGITPVWLAQGSSSFEY